MAYMAVVRLTQEMEIDTVCSELAAAVKDSGASISFFRCGLEHKINASSPMPDLKGCFRGALLYAALPAGWSVELSCAGSGAADTFAGLGKVFTDHLSSTFEIVDRFRRFRCSARIALETEDRLGLHARPSMRFIEFISLFNLTKATLRIFRRSIRLDGKWVWVACPEGVPFDALSIMEVLMANIENRTEFEVACEGLDAQEAVSGLQALFTEDDEFEGSTFQVTESLREIT